MSPTLAPSRAPRHARALAAALALLFASSALAPLPPAHAQADRPVISLELDGGGLSITSSWSWSGEVRVRIVDPAGRDVGSVIRRGAVPRTPPSARPATSFAVLLDAVSGGTALVSAGDIIEITYGGHVFRTVVPNHAVQFDAATDTVSGSFPSSTRVALAVRNARTEPASEASLDEVLEEVAVRDGRVMADLAGRFDVRPGTGVQVVFDDADGNQFITRRAVPSVDIMHGAIDVRADPGAAPHLVAHDGESVVWDSGPLEWSEGVTYEGSLSRSNDTLGLAYALHPGDRLSLWLGRAKVAEATVPALTGRHDPETGAVSGSGPAGATVVLARVGGHAKAPRTTVGPDGRFAFDPLPLPDRLKGIDIRIVDPTPFRFAWDAVETFETVTLYGNRLWHLDDGLGTTRITFRPADGGRAVTRTSVARPGLMHFTDLIDQPDHPVAFAPGDRIEIAPDGGTAVTLTVPDIGLTIDQAAQTGTGHGPPSSYVRIELGDTDLDRLAPSPSRVQVQWFRARTDAAGRFAFTCTPGVPCRSGTVDFTPAWGGPDTGRPTYRWFVQDTPLTGIAPDIAALLGFATAGTPVTATLLDGAGRPVAARTVRSGVDDRERPLWLIDWRDRFPDGIPAGTRFAVRVGDDATELRLPTTTVDYDVLTDEVWGTTPPDHALDVWVLPKTIAGNNVAPQHVRQPPIDGDGRWRVSFHDRLNVRAGDSLLVNVLAPDGRTFYQLARGPLDGPLDEPTETPAPLPTRVRTPTPEPSPTPMATLPPTRRPVEGNLWLPLAFSGP